MGGILASYIAAEYPDRVKGIVLIGPVQPAPAVADVFEKRIEVVKKGSFVSPSPPETVIIRTKQMDSRPSQTPFLPEQQGRKPGHFSMLSSAL